jgi:[ribosomal protein S5]-alanine N-acetyltransferase
MQKSSLNPTDPNNMGIRPVKLNDEVEYLANYKKNRADLKPWVHVPKNSNEFRQYALEMRTKENKAFVVYDKGTKKMIGLVELRDIYMFDFKNSYMVYFGFKPHLRKGLMSQAVKMVIQLAFKKLKLHRLEANIQPTNLASIALAKSCGFKREGYSPKFIKKNGTWKDHERWAILNEK